MDCAAYWMHATKWLLHIGMMVVPRHQLSTVGRRAFAVHGPTVWTLCLTTSAHSRTLAPSNRAWKLGCFPGTSVPSALETFATITLYKSTYTIPYHRHTDAADFPMFSWASMLPMSDVQIGLTPVWWRAKPIMTDDVFFPLTRRVLVDVQQQQKQQNWYIWHGCVYDHLFSVFKYNSFLQHGIVQWFSSNLHSSTLINGSVMKFIYEWIEVQCVQKKRDQNVFCNIFYKTQAIPMKFGTLFLE